MTAQQSDKPQSNTPRTDAWENEAEDATTYCIDGWNRARQLERELAVANDSLFATRTALDCLQSASASKLAALIEAVQYAVNRLDHDPRGPQQIQVSGDLAVALAAAKHGTTPPEAVEKFPFKAVGYIGYNGKPFWEPGYPDAIKPDSLLYITQSGPNCGKAE